jgi:hypothetical protein
MFIKSHRKYIILFVGAIVGLFIPCVHHTLWGHACPACGTRRALGLLLQGKWKESLLMNPLGILIVLFVFIFIAAFLRQKLIHRPVLKPLQQKIEQILKKWYVLLLIVVLTLLNWWWNILKFG